MVKIVREVVMVVEVELNEELDPAQARRLVDLANDDETGRGRDIDATLTALAQPATVVTASDWRVIEE